MAKDELAQLLEGPLMDDWLVAADFDTPEQPWVAHGAIVEHGGEQEVQYAYIVNSGQDQKYVEDLPRDKQVMLAVGPETRGPKGCLQHAYSTGALEGVPQRGSNMDCKANIVVIPGSGPVHNMEKPMIPPSSCHREAAQTAACGNGGRNAVDLFGIVSCDEDTLNYAQARSGGFPGLVLPEPLGSQVSRTPMYSMGGGGVTHHLNSVDRHSCMRQVPLRARNGNQRSSYYSPTACGLNVAGPSVTFPPGPKTILPKLSPISQALSRISTPLSMPQSHSHLDSLSQGSIHPGYITSEYHEGGQNLNRHCHSLPPLDSVPPLGTQTLSHMRPQEWNRKLPGMVGSMHNTTSGVPTLPPQSIIGGELKNLRKCNSTPILPSTISTNGTPTPANGEIQVHRIGKLTKEERQLKILRYKQKRLERRFDHRVTYQCRKTLADTRPRVRGRFAKTGDKDAVMPHEAVTTPRKRKCDILTDVVGAAALPSAKSAKVAY